jgi:hypothetical protein
LLGKAPERAYARLNIFPFDATALDEGYSSGNSLKNSTPGALHHVGMCEANSSTLDPDHDPPPESKLVPFGVLMLGSGLLTLNFNCQSALH